MRKFTSFKSVAAAVALIFSGLFSATPALAVDNYLFGFSAGSFSQQLVLNGGSIVIEATNTGWYSAPGVTDFPANDNYILGTYFGAEYRNFFTFNLSSVATPITSATLSIFNPSGGFVGSANTFYVYESSSLHNALVSGVDSATTFNGMNAGTIIGSQAVSSADNNTQLQVSLSAFAVAVLNELAGTSNSFAVTGTLGLSAVPVPAALPMMGAALAGLFGYARKRKAVAA